MLRGILKFRFHYVLPRLVALPLYIKPLTNHTTCGSYELSFLTIQLIIKPHSFQDMSYHYLQYLQYVSACLISGISSGELDWDGLS